MSFANRYFTNAILGKTERPSFSAYSKEHQVNHRGMMNYDEVAYTIERYPALLQ